MRELIKHLIYLSSRLDMIVVAPVEKWIYLKISKTAGTSIYRETIGKSKVVTFNSEEPAFNKWIKSLKDDKDLAEYKIFTIVRNPFERIISMYCHMKMYNGEENYHMEDTIKWLNNVKNNNWEHRKCRQIYQIRKGVSPLSLYDTCYLNDKKFVDYIGYYENLDQSWKDICKLINFPYKKLPHMNKSSGKTGEDLDHESRKVLKNFYQRDFETFYPNEIIFE